METLTEEKRDPFQSIRTTVICAAMFWLLACYLLPGIVWGNISFGKIVNTFLQNHLSIAGIIASVFVIGVPVLSIDALRARRESVAGKNGAVLLGLIGIYFLVMLVTFVMPVKNIQLYGDIARILLSLSMGLIAALLSRSVRVAGFVLIGIAAIQSVYAIYFLKQGTHVVQSGDILRAGGTFSHPADLYIFMLLALPVAVALLIEERRSSVQVLLTLSCAAIFAALMCTWYRGGIIAAGISLVYFAWQYFRDKRITLVIALCLTLAATATTVRRTAGQVNRDSANRSVSGRPVLLKEGLSRFKANWLTGVGVGCLEIPLTTPSKNKDVPVTKSYRDTKNLLVQWLAEMGIAGGILLGGFFLIIARILRNAPRSSLTAALGASWLALLAAGVFDVPFGTVNRLPGNALVGFLLGMTLIASFSKSNTQRTSTEEAVTE